MFNLLDLLKSYKVIDFSSLDRNAKWQISKQLKFFIDDNDISMNDVVRAIKGPDGLSYYEDRSYYVISLGNSNKIKFGVEVINDVKKKITTVDFM